MRLKAVLLALALGAVTAAGAAAEGGPGPGPGGGHPGPPPPGGQQPAKGDDHPGAAAEHAFRDQLTALGYTCMPRPVMVRGSLTAVGTDSLTLHPARAAAHGGTATASDVTAKVISTTQVRRRGPATVASLVVGDMVELYAVACRTTGAATGTPPTLVARLINAHPARV